MILVKSTNQPGDENMQQPISPALQDFQLKAKQWKKRATFCNAKLCGATSVTKNICLLLFKSSMRGLNL